MLCSQPHSRCPGRPLQLSRPSPEDQLFERFSASRSAPHRLDCCVIRGPWWERTTFRGPSAIFSLRVYFMSTGGQRRMWARRRAYREHARSVCISAVGRDTVHSTVGVERAQQRSSSIRRKPPHAVYAERGAPLPKSMITHTVPLGELLHFPQRRHSKVLRRSSEVVACHA